MWQPVLKRVSHTSSYSATVSSGFWQKVGNTAVTWLGLLREKRHEQGVGSTRGKSGRIWDKMRVIMEPQRRELTIGHRSKKE